VVTPAPVPVVTPTPTPPAPARTPAAATVPELFLSTPAATLAGKARRTLTVTARLGRAATLSLLLHDGRGRTLGRWRRPAKAGAVRLVLPVSAKRALPQRATLSLASGTTRSAVVVAIRSGSTGTATARRS
jgi:hypothetical protein